MEPSISFRLLTSLDCQSLPRLPRADNLNLNEEGILSLKGRTLNLNGVHLR